MYSEKEYDLILSKLSDIRNLFDESDMEAEGHGMEDMIADPYSVSVYAENKMKRLICKNAESETLIKLLEWKIELLEEGVCSNSCLGNEIVNKLEQIDKDKGIIRSGGE